MRAASKKTCPGCKQTGQFYTGDVCYECGQKLRSYDTLKAQAEMAGGERATGRVHFGEFVPLPIAAYKLPSEESFSRAMAAFICATAPAFKAPPKDLINGDTEWYHRGWKQYQAHKMPMGDGMRVFKHNSEFDVDNIVVVPDEFSQAYRTLMVWLAKLLKESYSNGQVYGQNLLFQMNAGDLSLKDFNDRLERANRSER